MTEAPAAPAAASWSPGRLALWVRAAFFVLSAILLAIQAEHPFAAVWLVGLTALGASTRPEAVRPRLVAVALVVEAIGCAVGVNTTGGSTSPLLPYLVAPAAVAGLRLGSGVALTCTSASLAGLLGSYPFEDFAARPFAGAVAEWILLSLLCGLIASWVRTALTRTQAGDNSESYEAAYRLLSQLRLVARQLSDGLDPVTQAHGLLTSLSRIVPFDRGVVMVRSQGERLVPLASHGFGRVDWTVDLNGDNPFAEAWVSQQPQHVQRQLGVQERRDRFGSSLVLPLRIGLRTFGLVGLEADLADAVQAGHVPETTAVVDRAALRLGTALLFDEVREVATVEERRRLAREIHDGIAQELASLGYLIDGLIAQAHAAGHDSVSDLTALRDELTRIIKDLRLSIFDLRNEVEPHGGLGAALSEYVRSVGTSSPFTVHLSLDETPTRLPAEAEAEVLRIAQEAITNARKHAGAHNLWVTCEVDPPRAHLVVEDDGTGIGTAREGSFGMEIMRERAERLNARLRITPREPVGTRVELVLGPPPATVVGGNHGEGEPSGHDRAAGR